MDDNNRSTHSPDPYRSVGTRPQGQADRAVPSVLRLRRWTEAVPKARRLVTRAAAAIFALGEGVSRRGGLPRQGRSEADGGPQRQDPLARTGTEGSVKTAEILGAVIPSIGVSVIVSMLISCKSGTEKLFVESSVLMGTVIEIMVAHRSEESAMSAIKEALGEFQRIDDLMSGYKPDSVVSRVNSYGSAGKVPVGEEVYRLLHDAVDISRASGGAFDVTIFPVSDLWGFDRTEGVPMPGLIAEKLKLVGYKSLIFDETSASVGFSIHGMGVDLGAIAKGWAVDRAMERLAALGVRNALIDAGGDIRTMGARPGKNFWRIGVQHPRAAGALIFTFEVRDAAIVTSGDYERFFEVDGVRYHHILDPANGNPARGCQSVTVLAPSAAEADACATAAFVLGPSEGIAFLRSRPGVRGVIVGADGQVHWSDESLSREARR